MKTLDTLTKDERSLVLFMESCATDYGGTVDTRRMNDEDMEIATRWSEEGFVKFGRISARSLQKMEGFSRPVTHWCELSEEAWELAHQERRARCTRMTKGRTWMKAREESEAVTV